MTDLAFLASAVPATAPAGGSLVWLAYTLFVALVLGFLVLDLGVFHRKAHDVSMKEAIGWSVVWLTLGVLFSGFVYLAYDNHWLGLGLDTRIYNEAVKTDPSAPLITTGTVTGRDAATQYLVGYVLEKSLAMDNIFVIALIFTYFGIPNRYQHRVLFWGIVGALIMRGVMIGIGGELILRYQWILIIFGLFLLLTAFKMLFAGEEKSPGDNPIVRFVKRLYPVTPFFDGQRFFTKRTVAPTYSVDPATGEERQDPAPPGTLSSRWYITPLLLALIMVEITDLVFAVDSIPAVFAVTPDTFIVFTSNIFAILGLRALYFCLAAAIAAFRFLKPALVLILAYVGVKLLLLSAPPYLDVFGFEAMKSIKIPSMVSLFVVAGVLAVAVVASIMLPRRDGSDSGPSAGAAA